MEAIDTPQSVIGKVPAIIASGRSIIIRYISPNTENFPSKRLTLAEEQDIHSHDGAKIGLVWESGYPTSAGYFTVQQAQKDAAAALEIVGQLNIPAIVPVFFAVDYDGYPVFSIDYFRRVHAVFTADSRLIGVYGSGVICKRLKGLGLVHYTWLAQSTGWSGYEDWREFADIVQGPASTVADLDVDTDVVANLAVLW